MSSYRVLSLILFLIIFIFSGCVTRKKKNETSKLGKFYHNTTAYYNGYWNSKEIMKESMIILRASNNDNYSSILEVEDYTSQPNPKIVAADMDKIIDKVSTVAALHEPSNWVDDCYVMMARAQYLKQDYETSEETLLYFQEEFNPSNPYGRNYKKKKLSKEALKKKREEEKKEQSKEKERIKKEQAAEKERLTKEKTAERERAKKEQLAERQKAAKAKEQERKQLAAEKEKQKQQNKKKSTSKRSTTRPTTTKNEQIVDYKEKDSESIIVDNPDSTNTKVTEPVTSISKLPKSENTKPTDADKEEQTISKPPKIEKDQTAYTEGMIWLAKVQTKRQKWGSAESVLRNIDSKQNLPDHLQADMAATYADLYLKQKKYDQAIPKLMEAAEHADNKQLKARYNYIIAQIHQNDNNYSDALKHFELAKKYSRDFKMEFMAGLSMARTAMLSGKQNKESILHGLQKMTGEDKYVDVKYLIYYTMGQIEFADNNEDKALEYFRQSNTFNMNDSGLKTEIYYSIANMYYGKEKYLDSKLYFDSTLISLPQTDQRYTTVKRLVDNLADIATNISIIEYQDTLLYIADLTGDAQKKAMNRLLEKKQTTADKSPSPGDKVQDNRIVARNNPNFGTSSFFAYNQSAKTKGKEDFVKVWGSRPLADNWRKGRSSGFADSGDKKSDLGASPEIQETKVSQEEFNALLRELPNNPIKKKEANDKIMNAMFTLGKLFRDKIENYAKSASTLEGMHNRFGFTPYELDSYYYLFLDYQDLNNNPKAKEYSDKILRKYPESKYAAIINDPDYFRKNKGEEDNLEQYYKETYAMFEKGNYAEAASRIEQASSVFGTQNKYVPKFALLGAMCMGSKEGKDAYIKALSDVIIAHPNTPEQIKAREIMRFLGGDNDAFKNVKVEDVDKIYIKEDDKVHYAVVITYGLSEVENVNVKVSVSEYNKKNFKLERLQLGDASLNRDDNSQIILIRKFENAKKSMEYYRKVMKDKDEFVTVKNINYDVFPISQTNYRKMLSEGSASAYRVFFEQHYLKIN